MPSAFAIWLDMMADNESDETNKRFLPEIMRL